MSPVDRCYQSINRMAAEAALVAGGLVRTGGGTRNTYYGLAAPVGVAAEYHVRVGAKAMRTVRRSRGAAGLRDLPVGKPHYYGKLDPTRVHAWARTLVETNFGVKPKEENAP